MIKYSLKSNCRTPTNPQKEIIDYSGLDGKWLIPHPQLYRLDREYVIHKEKYDKREMIAYDTSIHYEQLNNFRKKMWLMRDLEKEIISNPKYNKQSINITFNDYNGFRLIVGDIDIETYNYLKIDLIKNKI